MHDPLAPENYMDTKEVTLRGNHVLLEPLRTEHWRALYPDALEPGIFQHLSPGAEGSLTTLKQWIARRIDEREQGTAMPFLQRDPVTNKAIGCTAMFNISARHHRLEVGHTWIAKSHRKTGANTEAKLLLLTHAFESMRAIRVQFKVDTRNEVAQRALERLGAVKEGRMRNERMLADGWIQDAFVYSIIDREWPEAKKRLNGLIWNAPAAPRVRPTLRPDPPTGPILVTATTKPKVVLPPFRRT